MSAPAAAPQAQSKQRTSDKHVGAASKQTANPAVLPPFIQMATQVAPAAAALRSAPPAPSAKLQVGPPNDRFEQEAERTAEHVMMMRMPVGSEHIARAPLGVQRCGGCSPGNMCPKCAAAAAEEELQRMPLTGAGPSIQRQFAQTAPAGAQLLQRDEQTGGGTALMTPPGDVTADVARARGGGSALDHAALSFFQPRFGSDFSHVRMHTDTRAAGMSQRLQARAFTVGSDIFFGAGQFDAGSSGRKLLAHELTHVMQQTGGRATPATAHSSVQRAQALPDERAEDVPDPDMDEINAALRDTEEPPISSAPPSPQPAPEETGSGEDGGGGGGGGGASEEGGGAPPDAGGDEGGSFPDTESRGDTTEVVIPDFDTSGGGGFFCGEIVPPPGELEEGDNEPADLAQQSFAEHMLQFVGAAVGNTFSFITGPVSGLASLAGTAALMAWRALPLWVRGRAVNLAMAGTEATMVAAAEYSAPPPANRWVAAGLTEFFARLRALPDALKVAIFEKMFSIALGQNLRYMWGFLKGFLWGFVVDGAIGIVQFVKDLLCLIPQITSFIRQLRQLMSAAVEQVEELMIAIGMLEVELYDLARNAITEFITLMRQPWRIFGAFAAISAAGTAAAKQIGGAIADGMIRFFRLSADSMGWAIGRIAGNIVFEIAFTVVTWGSGGLVAAGKVLTRLGLKIMTAAGRAALQAMRFFRDIFGWLARTARMIVRPLTRGLRAVGGRLGGVMDRIRELFAYFCRYCRRGSLLCNFPTGTGLRNRLRRATDLWRRRGSVSPRFCQHNWINRLGGVGAGAAYANRVTGGPRDFKIWLGRNRQSREQIGLRCAYDGKRGLTVIEAKSGYAFLNNSAYQNRWWFRLVLLKLEEQRLRCGALAAICGYTYVWYMQDQGARNYLHARWGGVPPVRWVP